MQTFTAKTDMKRTDIPKELSPYNSIVWDTDSLLVLNQTGNYQLSFFNTTTQQVEQKNYFQPLAATDGASDFCYATQIYDAYYSSNGQTLAIAYKNRKLGWVAYIAGKRESRRLMGDYILKEDDLTKNVFHEDASFTTTWSIDLHWPDPENSKHFPGNEFKAVTKHILIYPYAAPYRCLYSRNINNLFMAGRNISVTHVALGTTRVMRTTGMMGEVVGMAASLCKKHATTPRGVYQSYLNELKQLMEKGVNIKGLPNNQQYNEGGTLKEKPSIR